MPKSRRTTISQGKPAFLFDLDGTLIDSVYQHVLAWREALREMDMELSTWRIHRRVGMSDGLIVSALQRETGRKLTKEDNDRLKRLHTEAFLKRVTQIRPLPGAGSSSTRYRGCRCHGLLPRAGWRNALAKP